jgi:hypothetical protein
METPAILPNGQEGSIPHFDFTLNRERFLEQIGYTMYKGLDVNDPANIPRMYDIACNWFNSMNGKGIKIEHVPLKPDEIPEEDFARELYFMECDISMLYSGAIILFASAVGRNPRDYLLSALERSVQEGNQADSGIKQLTDS